MRSKKQKIVLGCITAATFISIGISSSFVSYATETDSKVLGLSFEQDVTDHSGNEHHGSLNKPAVYTDGISGHALVFDGNTYIDLGTSIELQPQELTFSVWLQTNEQLNGEHMITWFKPNGNYQGKGWYLSCLDNNTPLKLSVGESTGQPMEIFVSGDRSAFFPIGEWVHIAVTYDSKSHTAAIYRNGIAQNVQYINNESEISQDETCHKYIGFNSPAYGGGYSNMIMDELSIYDKVLKSTDIVTLYTQFGATFDSEQVVENDYESLNLAVQSTKTDLILPTIGNSGSSITWTSSDETIISSNGKVTRPAKGESNATVTLTATISFASYEKQKSFPLTVEAFSAIENLTDFSLSDVELLDAYELNSFSLEIAYLKKLDADRLLRGFNDIAGNDSDASLYGGWESSAIKGHTLGHYLTAVSQAYATTKDEDLLSIVNHIVDVLTNCQFENGYLAAIPETHYIQLENGNTSGTWVPWYTMHKVLAGLIDAYELTGNENALQVASKLGDWVYSRTSQWNETTQKTVLNVEYGGMNDCLYQLYSHTKSEKHLSAAHSFDEMNLFDALYRGEDVLNGKHANTTIPKIIGALNRYIVLGKSEEYYLQVAENFWEMVVHNHTYITGGNSEWEHFGESGILDAERTNCNCETCNTYNMLKLSRELFKITGNSKYTDYYENAFINAILSSQNPETGMTTYFQPMASGFFKVYSSETMHFWCCTGSGMESFSKLNDSIYYKDQTSIYVTQFVSSKVTIEDGNMILTQMSDIPNTDTTTFTIETFDGRTSDIDLVLRVPDWCSDTVILKINGFEQEVTPINGFITLSDSWNHGDIITYTIPMEVAAYSLPDNDQVVAFKYGPVVLSANLGNENMETTTTGVNVTIPKLSIPINDTITITNETIDNWLSSVSEQFVKIDNELSFTLLNTDRNVVFTPHYQQYENRYGIYFRLADANTITNNQITDIYEVIDSLPVANDQYEFSHEMLAQNSATGMHKGLNYRDAAPGGYFSYKMAVDPTAVNYLSVQYFSGDTGRAFTILVDNIVLEEVTLENVNPDNFYETTYEIPSDLIAGKEKVTITFKADKNSYAGGIFETLSIVKNKTESAETISTLDSNTCIADETPKTITSKQQSHIPLLVIVIIGTIIIILLSIGFAYLYKKRASR